MPPMAPRRERLRGSCVLALDYGTKRTGAAVLRVGRDPWPLPLEDVPMGGDAVGRAAGLARREEADIVVMGLPLLLDGRPSDMTERVRRFGRALGKRLGGEVLYQDETLSTEEAKDRMRASPRHGFRVDPARVDGLAAAIILEDFLGS